MNIGRYLSRAVGGTEGKAVALGMRRYGASRMAGIWVLFRKIEMERGSAPGIRYHAVEHDQRLWHDRQKLCD